VITVTRDDDSSRYQGRLEDGELVTVIDFTRTGDVVDITYTGTKRRHRGRGFASSITRHVLDEIRAKGWKVRPTCGFTANYLDEHPEYADLRA
jgi:predicted GNAT family acetyltransferase